MPGALGLGEFSLLLMAGGFNMNSDGFPQLFFFVFVFFVFVGFSLLLYSLT